MDQILPLINLNWEVSLEGVTKGFVNWSMEILKVRGGLQPFGIILRHTGIGLSWGEDLFISKGGRLEEVD